MCGGRWLFLSCSCGRVLFAAVACTPFLCAQVLQTLSSGLAFGAKEPHMQPLNALVAALTPKLRLFLQKVTAPSGAALLERCYLVR
jgi:hypothetical protein